MKWKQALKNKRFLLILTMTSVFIIGILYFMSFYLPYINDRPGKVLQDPFLQLFPPTDLSNYFFPIMYGSILLVFIEVWNKPDQFIRLVLTIGVVYTIRSISLHLIHLDPPEHCILLSDPLIDRFSYAGQPVMKDLFFSGHTAMMMTLVLAASHRYLKTLLTILLVAVCFMLLFQHAHYTIDIIGALLITPICWILTKYLTKKMLKGIFYQ